MRPAAHQSNNYHHYYYYYCRSVLLLFSDVEKLLVGFGANFTKTIQNKKRKIETFTKESLEYSKRKMKEVNTKQSADR